MAKYDNTRFGIGRSLLFGASFLAWGLVGLLGPTPALAKEKVPQAKNADDLMVVDCLLPQKMRRLGRNNTYLAPRQPIRTTAVDCRIRGGEYTEPDAANYATSLKIWLPQAEAGEPEAMFYVGQIFEKGLGTSPDFGQAATWYRKAAEKGYAPAAVNLGSLYESGQGVARDEVEALNWYRKAAGLAQDLVVLQAAEYDALVKAKAELELKAKEVGGLQKEIEELRRQLEAAKGQASASEDRQNTLQSLLARLEADLATRQKEIEANQNRIAALEKQAAANAAAKGTASSVAAVGKVALKDIPFGQYHALVIGNAAYQKLPPLQSAASEAKEVADLLQKKYGFKVELLVDATRFDILEALNRYREKLSARDNLLVYYAGHGQRDADGQTAYWQPVDADAKRPTEWIPSGVLTEHLDLIAANHVFVVANSVFSGLRTRSSVARLPQGMTDEERYYHIKVLMEKKARLVLSSGGTDSSAMAKSEFGSAFLETLKKNNGVLEASAVYQQVNDQLFAAKQDSSGLEFAAMKWARNDLADFFFVPVAAR